MGHPRPMVVPILSLVAALILYSSCQSVGAQSTCSNSVLLTSNGSPTLYEKCVSLPKLASSLAWTYNASNLLFEFAFQTKLPNANGWAGWGIHPTEPSKMIGASSFIAFNAANGTNVLTYKLEGMPTNSTAIDLEVVGGSKKVLISDLDVTFGATLKLPAGNTKLYQLWNVGDNVDTFAPQMHAFSGDNMLSYSELDVTAGTVAETEIAHIDLKNRHGIINGIAWGIMFPLGVMAARYMRPFEIFNPLWFYTHVICQVSAYILGVTGWGMGLKLGSYASTSNDKHANLGTAMFTLATLQLTALFFRPNPEHQYRKYWNVYHHSVGFTLIILSVINVFEGIELLEPEKGWKTAYVIVLITIAAVALVLEISTWIVWYVRRKRIPSAKLELEDGNMPNGNRPAVYGGDNANQEQWVGEPQL